MEKKDTKKAKFVEGQQQACSTENHLQRGVTAYHPETAIPVIVHPRTPVRMGRWTRVCGHAGHYPRPVKCF